MTLRARALAEFLDRNPTFDIHASPCRSLDDLVWDGLDRTLVTDALRKAARLRHAVPDPLVAYRIAEAGYRSVHAIARRATAGFVRDLQGVLDPEAARAIQARARGAWDRVVQQWMQRRESVSQHRRAYLGPRAVQGTAPGDTTPVHYAALFGEAPIRDTPDAMSVFGPGAYFYDLMDLIDEEITRENPSIPLALTLRGRRPDLWNMPLAIGTIEDRVSYADLTREILESTLRQLAPEIPLLTRAAPAEPREKPSNVYLCKDPDDLQKALTGAADGDLIVLTGTFTMPAGDGLVVDKDVTLRAGAAGVSFDCSAGAAFTIRASKVAIEDVAFTDVAGQPAIHVQVGALTLLNSLFVCGPTAGAGWAVTCRSGQITVKSCTFVDPNRGDAKNPHVPPAMLAAANGPDDPDAGSVTFTLLNSILWTENVIPAGRPFQMTSGPAVFNLAYCDVRGGDPGDPRIAYADSNFVAEPSFLVEEVESISKTNYLRLHNISPCVGRGARGVNVGAAVYDVYAAVARAIHPFDTPFDTEVQSAVFAFDELSLSLPEVFEAFAPFGDQGAYSGVSTLGMGLGDFEVLSTPIDDASTLAPYYGLTSFDSENVVLTQQDADAGTYTFRAADFARWTGMTLEGLRELVYQNLSLSEIAAGVQRGKAAWAGTPARAWPGFYVNADQAAALALRTVYAPVGRGYPTLSAGAEASFDFGVSFRRPFTISVWMYVHEAGGCVFYMSGTTALVWLLEPDGTLRLSYDNTEILRLQDPALIHGWVCLTTTYEANEIAVYVNGRCGRTQEVPAAVASKMASSTWSLACLRGTTPNVTKVAYADLQVWNLEGAPETIARDFQRPPLSTAGASAPPGLVGYWPLNDHCQSTDTGTDLANWVAGGTSGRISGSPASLEWGAAYLPEYRPSGDDESTNQVAPGKTCCDTGGLAYVEAEVLTGESDAGRVGLDVSNLDRVNRFVRLARRLGWSFADLDWALYTVLPGDFTNTGAFDRLAALSTLQDVTDLGPSELCAFFGYLKPYGRGREDDVLSAFDRVYNRPPLAGVYFTPIMSFSPLSTPKVEVFEAKSDQSQRPTVTVSVGDEYKVLGGGALDVGTTGRGNMLTASYPASSTAWQAIGKDKDKADPATLTAYAIALHDPDDEWETAIVSASSEAGRNPTATAELPSGYVMTGGGAYVDFGTGDGNLLTASYPSGPRAWTAWSKDQTYANQATITAYAIGLRRKNGPTILLQHISSATGATAENPTASVRVEPGFTLTGGGARDGSGTSESFLTASYPSQNDWSAAGTYHLSGDQASATAYAIGVAVAPDPAISRRIASSLGLTTAELRRVMTAYAITSLSWATLSALFRFRALLALLRMGVEELIELAHFAGVEPLDPAFAPDDLLKLVKTHRIAQEAKIGPASLVYLITDPETIDPPEDPYQRNLQQRFRDNLPTLRAGFRRSVTSVHVTPQSFVRPGVGVTSSAKFFQACVDDGYLTPSGLCRSALYAKIPEVAMRVPAQYPTLSAAVDAAIGSLKAGAASAVVLIAPGEYSGADNTRISVDLTGVKGTLTLQSEAGAESTVLDCSQMKDGKPVLSVSAGAALVVDGLTIWKNTTATLGTFSFDEVPQVAVRGCRFLHNTADEGGGLRFESSSADVQNCVFYKNTAQSGGAIDVSSSRVRITTCTLYENSVTDGAIHASGTATSASVIHAENSILWEQGYEVDEYSTFDQASSCFDSEDPLLVAPEYGDFTLNPDSPAREEGQVDPGYQPDLAFGPDLLSSFAFAQLEVLRKSLVSFLDCGDLPLVPILRYLGSVPSWNGIEILGSDITDPDPIAYLRYVYLYLLLAFEVELGASEISLLLADPSAFGFSTAGDELWIPTRKDLHTLARYLLLKQEYPSALPDLLKYLRDAAQERPSVEAATKALSDLFTWDPTQVGALLHALEKMDGEPPTPALTAILDVSRALDMAGDTGLGIGLLRALNQNGFVFGGDGATPLLQAIAASDAEAAQRLFGRISEMKRSILKIFAVPAIDSVTQKHGYRVRDEDDLSEYLLVDVAMGAETDTSRVVQGTLSLQQYVQRVRLGLEPSITSFDISDERWGWMDTYRTWEANRRVFLYPENYLRPELRKDGTPLYAELLDAVNGADITKKDVERLYKTYLDGFATLATLRTVGAWYTQDESSGATAPPGEQIGRYHLVGRTTKQPHVYYCRTYEVHLADGRARTAAIWTPWERIELDIGSDYATPVVFRGQLYLFWSEAVLVPEDDPIFAGHYQIKLRYAIRGADGAWGAPQQPFPEIHLPADVVPASDPVWRRPYVVPTTYEGAPALFVQYGGYSGESDPFLFVLRQDQSVVGGLVFGSAMSGSGSLLYSALVAGRYPGKIGVASGAQFSAANALPLESVVAVVDAPAVASSFQYRITLFSRAGTALPSQPVSMKANGVQITGVDATAPALVYHRGRYYVACDKVGKLYSSAAPDDGGSWQSVTTQMIGDSLPAAACAPQIASAHGLLYAVYRTTGNHVQLIRSKDGVTWEAVWSLSTSAVDPTLAVIGDALFGVYVDPDTKALWAFRQTEKGHSNFKLNWANANKIYEVSQLAYWRGAWYCAVTSNYDGAKVHLLHAAQLDGTWTNAGAVGNRAYMGSTVGNTQPGLGLVGTAEALYLCYGLSTSTSTTVSEGGNFKYNQVLSCADFYPLRVPWAMALKVSTQDYNSANIVSPVSPLARGAYAKGPSSDLLTNPGDAPSVVPVGNQLGAFVVGTDGGDYLVEATSGGQPVNVQVQATIAGLTVTLGARGGAAPDLSAAKFQFSRLGSTAALTLAKRLNEGGIDALMAPETQRAEEYAFVNLVPTNAALGPSDDVISFRLEDAYGLYYREVFTFIPWLLAEKLRENLRYKEAQKWLDYVVCPTGLARGEGYWRSVWLAGITPVSDTEDVATAGAAAMAVYHEDPFNASALADLREAAYQKAIFMAYVQNLIDWGDDRFALSTRETINEAAQLYRFAKDLLGPEPKLLPYVSPRPQTYAELAARPIALEQDAVGSPVARSLSTVYKAAGDGFVTAMIWWALDGDRGYLLASSDASPAPSTLRGAASMHYWTGSAAQIREAGLTTPVRAGDYYSVAFTKTCATPNAGASLVHFRFDSGVTFGAWSEVPLGPSQVAATSGFLVGVVQCGNGATGTITGSQTQGASTIAVTASASYQASSSNFYVPYESFCLPVAAGASFQVTLTKTVETATAKVTGQAFFLPLSGGELATWATRVAGQAYEAECGGFLLAMIAATASGAYGYVDICVADTQGSLDSATPRGRASCSSNTNPNVGKKQDVPKNAAMVPVAKGSFYKIRTTATGQVAVSVWWFPFAAASRESGNELLIEIAPADPVSALEYDPNGSLVAQGVYFGVPDNPRFANTWNVVNDRLFKIRHGLDLNGEPNRLPLFAPEVDPMDFVRAAAAGGQGSTSLSAGAVADMETARAAMETAKGLAQTVMEYGRSLLSALESKDAAVLAALQARQETVIADQMRRIRVEEVNEARATLQSLESARAAARHRKQRYEVLNRQGLSRREAAALKVSQKSLEGRRAAAAMNYLSVPLYLLPNVFGLANGGMDFGQSVAAAATTADSIATALGEEAALLTTQADHERRADEWRFEAKLAGYDVEQLDAEIEAAARRVRAAEMQYALEETSLKQKQEIDKYYQSRFTNAELYQWMADTLGDLYYQLYQIADAAARTAQARVNAATGQSATFVSPGAWDAAHRGLLAGERLYVDLARMDQELSRWEGAELDTEIPAPISLSRSDPFAMIALQASGACIFDIREEDLDRDHPGLYMRRIREISIELRGWEGEAVHGELSQLSGSVVWKPEIDTVRFLLGRDGPSPGALGRRLLPFRARFSTDAGATGPLKAFTGAPLVGRYRLSIAPSAQRIDLSALRDVVLRVRYEARDGGDAFRSAVLGSLPPFRDLRWIDVAAANPDGWARLVEGGPRCEIRFDRKGFARNLPGRVSKVVHLGLYLIFDPLEGDDGEEIQIGCGPWLAARAVPIPAAGGAIAIEQEVSIGLDELCRKAGALRLGKSSRARAALRAAHLVVQAAEARR